MSDAHNGGDARGTPSVRLRELEQSRGWPPYGRAVGRALHEVVECIENPDLWGMDDRLVYSATLELRAALDRLNDALEENG